MFAEIVTEKGVGFRPLPFPLPLQKGKIFVNRCPAQITNPCQFRNIQRSVVVSVSGVFGCLDKHQKGVFWAVLGIIIGGMGVLYAFELL